MSIQGKTIVFTGKISKPRHEFQKLVEEHGGVAGSDVTNKTDYLVVGEKPGSKLMRATILGIPTISEEEFLKLLQQEETEDTPLSFAELQEIEANMEERTCDFCHRSYKVFKTVQKDGTCPLCEPTKVLRCPKCGCLPMWITDFNLYHCSSCWDWFKAPFSHDAQKIKHLHIWFRKTEKEEKTIEECFCGAVLITHKDGRWEKHESSHIIEEGRKEAHEFAVGEERRFHKEREEKKKEEAEVFKFIESLTPSQIELIKLQMEWKEEENV